MKREAYVSPQVLTLDAREVLDSLGPATAGSSVAAGKGFEPNLNSCGFPMGNPCP